MPTLGWLGLVQLASIALVNYLAREKKTRLAWTGAGLLFTGPLTLIVFLIVEARARKETRKAIDGAVAKLSGSPPRGLNT